MQERLPDFQPSFTLTLGPLVGRLVKVSSVWLLEFRDPRGNRVGDQFITVTTLAEKRYPSSTVELNLPVWYLTSELCYELKYGDDVKTLSFPRSPQVN